MSRIWSNFEPIIDITEMTSPDQLIVVIGKAVNQSQMKSLALRMHAEQLTEPFIQALDCFAENRVEVIVVSGTVNRTFVERCRLSKTVTSVECLEGVHVAVPQTLIEAISQG